MLKNYLKTLPTDRKQVIFIDELPWVDTPKSGFIQLLAHFWNDYLSKEPHFMLVICGSASSWIVKKVLNDPGGLHNRVTENIHLYPFTLSETRAFLLDRGFQFSIQDIARIYMSLGGIPFYLEQIRRGESIAAAIERLCFAPTGILYYEYNNLFQALFKNAAIHQQIVGALAEKNYGLSHSEIQEAIGLKQASGTYQRAIEELLVSDFITEVSPLGKQKRGTRYRLIDEFSLFYHRFIQQHRKYSPGIWQQLSESQAYKIWTGYAFENLCMKHISTIKQALGISGVYTETSGLRVPAKDGRAGFQIDLLIDRRDNCINLCEIKFHQGVYTISKAEYLQVLARRQAFIDYTGTSKQVFITFISNHGLHQNEYSRELIDVQIELEQLIS